MRRVTISGNNHLSKGRIRSLMETSGKSLTDRILFLRKAPSFHYGELESDINRIKMYYQREGFLNADIQYELTYSDNKVKVKLLIDENRRVRVSSAAFNLIDTEDINSHSEILATIKSKSRISAGVYFRDVYLREDIDMIKDYYDLNGYPHIAVDYQLLLSDDELNVAVNYNISPGKRAYIGTIDYEGLKRTESKLLEKLISFSSGDEYDRNSFDETRRNLQATGLFRLVSVGLRLEEEAQVVPAEIYIREKDNITLSFGVGYGIEEHVRVYGEITKLRFLGGLRTGTLFLKHSALEPVNADLKVVQPVFPTIKSNIVLNPFYRQEEEPAYSIERLGINTTLNHRLTLHTGTFLTYSFEDNRLKSGTDDAPDSSTESLEAKEDYRKSSISVGLLRDSSHPDFFPEGGSLASIVSTFSGLGFNSDYRYMRMLMDFRKYQLIGSTVVLAARIKGGFIEPLTDEDFIPYEDRFYAGGAFSVRGWQRAELGPKNSDGDPIGGKSYLEGSLEIRYPVWQQLSLVNFLDFGNVWQDRFSHDIQDLRFAAGSGLRYATPIGPVRLDVAVPVFDEERKVQFFISLGQMF